VNLETISALAQLIAAVGVILSLFYLAVQIRQNTRSMRAIVVDPLAQSIADLNRPLAQDIGLARAFSTAIEDWNGVTSEERTRLLFLFFASFKLFQNAWFQKRQGTLDPQQWEGWDALIRMYYHRPGIKTWCPMRSAAFAVGFRNYIERSEPLSDLAPISEIIRGQP
jgi:hypothetical protein